MSSTGAAARSREPAIEGFKPVPYSAVPGWLADNHARAFAAFRRSCPALISRAVSPSATPLAHALAGIAQSALKLGRTVGPEQARVFFQHFFVPHAPRDPAARGLLTGYYEPWIAGSRRRGGRYQQPLYRRPADLENVIAEERRGAAGGGLTHMRRTATGLVAYPTRAEIEAGALDGEGLESVWLADAVDAFFTQVQGSALIRLAAGGVMRLAYDGKNGHPYTSIGRVAVERGYMTTGEVTMASLAAWLRADPGRGRELMQANASFVFFREMQQAEGPGPLGAIGCVLTPGRSLAVDTSHIALGLPVLVDVPGLRDRPGDRAFRRLMIAQDVGSAIRGAQRGDIYFGSGDGAASIAGRVRHRGRFHVLLPRSRGLP